MSDTELNAYIIIIAFVILGAIIYDASLHQSDEYKEITIKEKWVKYQSGEAKYLVSDTNDNVYSITDSWWFLIFDASDRYAKIEIGSTYKVKMIGWRIRILSEYQNIIELNKVN